MPADPDQSPWIEFLQTCYTRHRHVAMDFGGQQAIQLTEKRAQQGLRNG